MTNKQHEAGNERGTPTSVRVFARQVKLCNVHIGLERFGGTCRVYLDFGNGGKRVEIIEDSGDIIGHCVHPSGIVAALEKP